MGSRAGHNFDVCMMSPCYVLTYMLMVCSCAPYRIYNVGGIYKIDLDVRLIDL